jgi:hypothetical protein
MFAIAAECVYPGIKSDFQSRATYIYCSPIMGNVYNRCIDSPRDATGGDICYANALPLGLMAVTFAKPWRVTSLSLDIKAREI